MRIAKDFLREAIQFVATTKPPAAFEIGEGADWKLQESRTYKLCMQPEEENSPVYLLTAEDLLRGNTLTAFNNEQAMFEEQMLGNLDACLLVVLAQKQLQLFQTALLQIRT
eukprot:6873319-Ditylum_brightwellii.AAC.1